MGIVFVDGCYRIVSVQPAEVTMYNGWTMSNSETKIRINLCNEIVARTTEDEQKEFFSNLGRIATPDTFTSLLKEKLYSLLAAENPHECDCVLPEQSCKQCRAAARKMVDLEFGEALPY